MASLDHVGIIEGSIDDGGWRATGNIFGDADRLDWYQEVESWYFLYRGGGWEGAPRLGFRGHLMPDPWDKTYGTSIAPYTAFTCQEFMKRGELQGIFFKQAALPANSHQITTMVYAEILEHIVGNDGDVGHCNLVLDAWPDEGFARLNIDKTNSTPVDSHEIKSGNFWMRLQELATIETYVLFVDKTNTINYLPHPMFGTLPTVTMDFTSAHMLEPLKIVPRNQEQIGQVRLQGTTPSGEQIAGKHPTDPTAGPVLQKTGFKSADTSTMNTVAERMYRFENRAYTVQMILPGAAGLLFDLLDRVSITYTSTVDGITWSAEKFWIHQIRVQLRDNFNAQSTLLLESEN